MFSLLVICSDRLGASFVYSTDLNTDELVRIDTATGAVSVIGGLGFDAQAVDLVTIGARLFAVNSEFETGVDLYELNPLTGSPISSVQVERDGASVLLAEGLSQLDGQLIVGFRDVVAPFSTRSNVIGVLGFNGVISDISSSAASYTAETDGGIGLDFDGLAGNPATGQLYGVDPILFNRPNDVRFFTVTRSPLAIDEFLIHSSMPLLAINDIEFEENRLLGIEGGNSLYSVELTTRVLSSIPLNRVGSYSGLAIGQATGVIGDFNQNGRLDVADIDLLSAEIRAGTNTAKFDVNNDRLVDKADREVWVNSLRKTYFGDANLDGEFSSADFVLVFTRGQYEDSVVGNSTWATGDWDGDGDFTTSDFVTAFQAGGYEAGPRTTTATIPEPTSLALILWILVSPLYQRKNGFESKSGDLVVQ